LCIESVQACQYSGGVKTGDVGVAIGRLQNGQLERTRDNTVGTGEVEIMVLKT
jgi:hypothetical protein